MNKKFLILDCFVDEPACFGVPPFVSPYPRYVFGALLNAGADAKSIRYITIETLRESGYELDDDYDMVFLIGGAVVPGKYLGHKIGTAPEVRKIMAQNRRQKFAAGGLISRLLDGADNCVSVSHDIEKFAHGICAGQAVDTRRTYGELRRWASAGAEVVRQHPGYPNLICEIESYRGCPRLQHCSFCSEGVTHDVEFRDAEDMICEVRALIGAGISRFRIGRQADILQYKTEFREYRSGFPRPEIAPVADLFSALKALRDRGDITTLNIDNANPGTIANFPDESSAILEIIANTITPGDTLALGVESFDPTVIRRNNLKVGEEDLIRVVRIVNEIGGARIDGIPALLPGINLIHGLIGESADTFKMNYESLARIRDMGLLVKRINIRKIMPFPGTPLAACYREPTIAVRNRYEFYRDRIRNEIDHFMLARVYPVGTVLKGVFIEDRQFEYSLGKQIASYSITAKIPTALQQGSFHDVIVAGHRERSVLALPFPIAINTLPARAIATLPGISKKGASDLVLRRPLRDLSETGDILANVPGAITGAIRFDS